MVKFRFFTREIFSPNPDLHGSNTRSKNIPFHSKLYLNIRRFQTALWVTTAPEAVTRNPLALRTAHIERGSESVQTRRTEAVKTPGEMVWKSICTMRNVNAHEIADTIIKQFCLSQSPRSENRRELHENNKR
ncbi:hypothetical protein FGIG_00087 [Fasciola gigantica]|uniref:Uncharacterized protein n=1 Tax=Fasciola gigantica TaxID=46835 RepID=A0A504YZP9_FASGI|nr:hypothetical protein FGIG_00087 [Fasciola gigantica]